MVRYLCKNEEYTSALERIRNFLRDRTESPLYPEALMLAATVFDRSGNHEQTIEYVDRLLDKYPNSPLAVESAMLGGSSCFRQGNY
jgi:TolA-binding protein